MNNGYVWIYIFSVFIASVSQILLKKSANKDHKSKANEYLNVYVIIAYTIFVLSTLLTIIAFKGVALKYGPIIESAGYIFILILARVFLKEKVTLQKVIGNFLIIAGIIIFVG